MSPDAAFRHVFTIAFFHATVAFLLPAAFAAPRSHVYHARPLDAAIKSAPAALYRRRRFAAAMRYAQRA